MGAAAQALRSVFVLTRVGVDQAKVWRLRAAYNIFIGMADLGKVRVFPEWQTYIDNAQAEAEILDADQPDADPTYVDKAFVFVLLYVCY